MDNLKILLAGLVLLLEMFHHAESQFMPGQPMYPGSSPMQMMPSMGMPMMAPMMGPPKLPVVVMPYTKKRKSKNKKKKKGKYIVESNESGSLSDESYSGSGEDGRRAIFRSDKDHRHADNHRDKKRRQVLTPVISYVTKDGYVVYQKKIKKDTAKDWLEMGRRSRDRISSDHSKELGDNISSDEVLHLMLKKKLKKYEENKMNNIPNDNE